MCLCQFELVEWHATARKLTLKLKMETIMLIICKKKGMLNGNFAELDMQF